MTTSQVIECHQPILHIERPQPRYSLLVSADRVHREAAQRLRYQVFASEPGFTIPHSADALDADHYDEFCDHILVRENATDEIVGCYRMLPPDAAVAAGGYYTATEFDLSALDPAHNRIVEMGRAVVAPAHRSGTVLSMMWSGILAYLELAGHSQVMGAVSVPIAGPLGQEPAANVRAVRDFALAKHANPAGQRVVPRNPVVIDGRALDDISASPRPQIPPLLRGYLRMGATICGEPAHDPDFGVADFFALQSLAGANRRYLDRLRSAASKVEAA
ncbi:GNAT family N-acetyltransferase [Tomitella biformata]|uniref:GNAT family N-acetyltransferase n=1 Tax=Tomitella biformata TaxID=630403 RepID=UPI000465D44F|nr:GNAT family N-acyltransferase [Tomitella biformata]